MSTRQWLQTGVGLGIGGFVILSGAGSSSVPAPAADWNPGPSRLAIRDVAGIAIPRGFLWLDEARTRALLLDLGSPRSGHEVGIIAPVSGAWFGVVEFMAAGWIPNDRARDLDPASLLEGIQLREARANQDRRRKGWPDIGIEGWQIPPKYDPEGHRFEWAIRAGSLGSTIINHSVVHAGRRGIVLFSLANPAGRESSLDEFLRLLQGFAFHPGERHEDFHPGDPLARDGLAGALGLDERLDPAREAQGSRPPPVATSGPTPEEGWLWAAPVAAGIAGFVGGRCCHSRGRGSRRRRPGPDCRVQVEVASDPSRTDAPDQDSGTPRASEGRNASSRTATRRRRFNAYSFHSALTRDLYRTLNS